MGISIEKRGRPQGFSSNIHRYPLSERQFTCELQNKLKTSQRFILEIIV